MKKRAELLNFSSFFSSSYFLCQSDSISITPYWKEAKEMCLKAAEKVPEMRFIAWDVAITENGPTFIEGNSFPSHAVPQFAAHYPDGIGILPEFRKFIDI